MLLNEEIGSGWCFGLSWRCTPIDAIGLWSVMIFYNGILVMTIIHYLILQARNVQGSTPRASNPSSQRWRTTTSNDEMKLMCMLITFFFVFAMGCLLWVLNPKFIHPVQIPAIQLLGSFLLLLCEIGFIKVHIDLGDSWYPIPNSPPKLITHGIFQYARHPMYAIFIWAAIGSLLATLNFVITWLFFGLFIMVFFRIKTEEEILINLFGDEYLEYRKSVSALGPGWCCLGFGDKASIQNDEVLELLNEFDSKC